MLQPGEAMPLVAGGAAVVFFVLSGEVEVRWEAQLPVSITSVLNAAFAQIPGARALAAAMGGGDAAAAAAGAAPDDGGIHWEDTADSLAHGLVLHNLGAAAAENSEVMGRSETLAATALAAATRAEALLKNAK